MFHLVQKLASLAIALSAFFVYTPTLHAQDDANAQIRSELIGLNLFDATLVGQTGSNQVYDHKSGIVVMHAVDLDTPLMQWVLSDRYVFAYPDDVMSLITRSSVFSDAREQAQRSNQPQTIKVNHYALGWLAVLGGPGSGTAKPIFTRDVLIYPQGEIIVVGFQPLEIPNTNFTATEYLDYYAILESANQQVVAMFEKIPEADSLDDFIAQARAASGNSDFQHFDEVFWKSREDWRVAQGLADTGNIPIRTFLNGSYQANATVRLDYILPLFAYMETMSAKCRDAINVPVPVEITTTNITRDVRTGEEISSRPGNRRTVWVEARMSPIYSAKFDQYQRIIDGIGGRTVVQGIQDLFSPGEPRAGEVYAAGLASREDMLWLIDQVGCDQAVLDQLGENLRRYGLGLPSLQDETGQATGSASVLTWFKVDQSRSVLGLLIDGFATPENQDASYFEDTLRSEIGSDLFGTNFGSFSRRNLFVTSAQTAPNGLKEMRLHRISNEYTNIMLPDALHVGKSNADETFRRFYIPLPYEPTILECIYADGTVTRQWYELGEWLEEQPEGFLSRFDFPASHPLAKILVRTGQSEQGIHMSNVCS